jgi:hypothetical protein
MGKTRNVLRSQSYERSIASSKASSPECDLLLFLSNSTIFPFPLSYPVATHVFFLVFSLVFFSLYIYLNEKFEKVFPAEGVANPFKP